ncbi:MAG TPA: hypothetical protein VK191_08000 [Symbiobacteriaceae bacterium]|nr:hypothetical protein [Symbiobacteriaceae bacterium]
MACFGGAWGRIGLAAGVVWSAVGSLRLGIRLRWGAKAGRGLAEGAPGGAQALRGDSARLHGLD